MGAGTMSRIVALPASNQAAGTLDWLTGRMIRAIPPTIDQVASVTTNGCSRRPEMSAPLMTPTMVPTTRMTTSHGSSSTNDASPTGSRRSPSPGSASRPGRGRCPRAGRRSSGRWRSGSGSWPRTPRWPGDSSKANRAGAPRSGQHQREDGEWRRPGGPPGDGTEDSAHTASPAWAALPPAIVAARSGPRWSRCPRGPSTLCRRTGRACGRRRAPARRGRSSRRESRSPAASSRMNPKIWALVPTSTPRVRSKRSRIRALGLSSFAISTFC